MYIFVYVIITIIDNHMKIMNIHHSKVADVGDVYRQLYTYDPGLEASTVAGSLLNKFSCCQSISKAVNMTQPSFDPRNPSTTSKKNSAIQWFGLYL